MLKIPRPPQVQDGNQWRNWFETVYRILNSIVSFQWVALDLTGSNLNEIETRNHNDLQNIPVITGTAGEVEVTDGDGIAGNPTIGLPTVITSPRSFGDGTNQSTFEADGTLVFEGTATVWNDIIMPAFGLNVGGTPPTLISYNTGNASAYSFSNAGTISMFGWAEIPHYYKTATDLDVHVHFSPISALTAGQTILWTFRYDIIPMGSATHTTGTMTGTYTVPVGGIAAWAHVYLDLGTLAGTGRAMGDNIGFELVRAAGTVTTNVCLLTVGIHHQCDTAGSRTEYTK